MTAGAWIAARLVGLGGWLKGLDWARLLPWLLAIAGAVALVWAVRGWGYDAGVAHERPLAEARGWTRGSDDQVAADGRAVLTALLEARARQHALGVKLGTAQAKLNQEIADDRAAGDAALQRRYAEWLQGRRAEVEPLPVAPARVEQLPFPVPPTSSRGRRGGSRTSICPCCRAPRRCPRRQPGARVQGLAARPAAASAAATKP